MGIFKNKTYAMVCLLSASLLASACGQGSSEKRKRAASDSEGSLRFFAFKEIMEKGKSDKMRIDAELRALSLPMPSARVQGSLLMVDNKPYTIKGVCYAPRRLGMRAGMDKSLIYQEPTLAERDRIWADILLMEEASINTIRVYEPILDAHVLEMFHVKGIKIIQNVVINAETAKLCEKCSEPKLSKEGWWYNDTSSPTADAIKKLAKHPTTLMLEVGNEWTLNYFYQRQHGDGEEGKIYWTFDDAASYMGRASEFVKTLAPHVPLTSSVSGLLFGFADKPAILNGFKYVDIWGINTYDSFYEFNQGLYEWATWTTKPYYLSEFGADRWHAWDQMEKESIAAEAAGAYIDIIRNHLELTHPGQRGIGGTIFTFQDEYWGADGHGDVPGSPSVQEKPGVPENPDRQGIHGDGVFNEEFFGLMSNDRSKKFSAFEVVKAKYRYEMP